MLYKNGGSSEPIPHSLVSLSPHIGIRTCRIDKQHAPSLLNIVKVSNPSFHRGKSPPYYSFVRFAREVDTSSMPGGKQLAVKSEIAAVHEP
jgi:hypothetical protein